MSQATYAPKLYDCDFVLYTLNSAVRQLEDALVELRSVGLAIADLPQTVVVSNVKEEVMGLHLKLFQAYTAAKNFHDAVLQAAAPELKERPSAKGLTETKTLAVEEQLRGEIDRLYAPINLVEKAANDVKALSYLLPLDFYNDALLGAVGLMLEVKTWVNEASKIEELKSALFPQMEEEQ